VERIQLDPGASWRDAARRAAAVLRAGGVALLPAEGVYGLHAWAEHPGAVARLLALKPREGMKGFIGLIGDPEDAGTWAETGPLAETILNQHWPGALTLVLRARGTVPESMRHPEGTVALRCPGNPFLRAAVQETGGIVISTSANEPGNPPMVRVEGPLETKVDLVVDQGTLSGTPSTIVLVQGESMRVLREGAVDVSGRRA